MTSHVLNKSKGSDFIAQTLELWHLVINMPQLHAAKSEPLDLPSAVFKKFSVIMLIDTSRIVT